MRRVPASASEAQPPSNRIRWTRGWAIVASLGVVVYAAIDVVLAVLRPDVRLLRDPESDYGNGPWSWLMDLNFLIRGGLSVTAVVALAPLLLKPGGAPRGPDSPATSGSSATSDGSVRVGLALVVVWAAASALLAFAPDDLRGAKPTAHGELHLFAALVAFVCVAAGTVILSRAWPHLPAGSTAARVLSILSAAGVVALVLLGLSRLPFNELGGLWERVFLGLELAWLLAASLSIARRPIEARSTPDD